MNLLTNKDQDIACTRDNDNDHIQCWRPWWLACALYNVQGCWCWPSSLVSFAGHTSFTTSINILILIFIFINILVLDPNIIFVLARRFASSSGPGFGECVECRWAFSPSHPPGCKLWPNFYPPDALSDIMCHRCPLFIFFSISIQYNINEVQRGKLFLLFHMYWPSRLHMSIVCSNGT